MKVRGAEKSFPDAEADIARLARGTVTEGTKALVQDLAQMLLFGLPHPLAKLKGSV